jgi:hypothetical protein
MLPVVRVGSRARLTCWVVKAFIGCLARIITISLPQPFPQLAGGLVCLFLSCADDPVDPAFEVGRSRFLISVDQGRHRYAHNI